MGKPETANGGAMAAGHELDRGRSEDGSESGPTVLPDSTLDTEAIDSEWPSDGRVPGETALKVPSYPLLPRWIEEHASTSLQASVHPASTPGIEAPSHAEVSEDSANAAMPTSPAVQAKASDRQLTGEADEEDVTPLATAVELPLVSSVLTRVPAHTTAGLETSLAGEATPGPTSEEVSRPRLALGWPPSSPTASPKTEPTPTAQAEPEPEPAPAPPVNAAADSLIGAPVARAPEPIPTPQAESAAASTPKGQAESTAPAEVIRTGEPDASIASPKLTGPTPSSPFTRAATPVSPVLSSPGNLPPSAPLSPGISSGGAAPAVPKPVAGTPSGLRTPAARGPFRPAPAVPSTAKTPEQPLVLPALKDDDLRRWAQSVKPKRRWWIGVTLGLALGGIAVFLLRPVTRDELEDAIQVALSTQPTPAGHAPEPSALPGGSLPAAPASAAPAARAPTPSSSVPEARGRSAVSGPLSVSIDTTPPKALVFQGTRRLGKSPLAIELESGEKLNLLIAYDGYEPQKIQVDGTQPKLSLTLVPYGRK
jgi:hypothetical protein